MKLPPGSECPEGYYFSHTCCGGQVNCEPYSAPASPDGSFEPCDAGSCRIVVLQDLGADFTKGSVHCVTNDQTAATWQNRGMIRIIEAY